MKAKYDHTAVKIEGEGSVIYDDFGVIEGELDQVVSVEIVLDPGSIQLRALATL